MNWRRIKELWRPALMLFGAAALLFLLYNLYSAWMHQTILAKHKGWITRDAFPVAFWWAVIMDSIALVAVAGLAVFLFRADRIEARGLRRFETRPPIEKAVRQSTIER